MPNSARIGAVDAVRVTGLGKVFGTVPALSSVDMSVAAGTVHALVGQNGAGKSTLLGILAGRLPPTTGAVEVFGRRLVRFNPRACRAAGIAAIYQELTTVPALSAAANVFLGQTPSRFGMLDGAAMRARYRDLSDRLAIQIPPGALAGTLSVAQRQLLEVMRALNQGARILLLDEPTASLGHAEREGLLRVLRQLRREDVTQVFVSHHIGEVRQIADQITVFRDGRVADSRSASGWTRTAIIHAMLGTTALPRRRLNHPATVGEPPGAGALRVADMAVPGVLSGVDFTARTGEILGVAGLMGSGRSALLRSLAGLEPASSGRLCLDGAMVPWPRSVRQALGYGLALVPEDRGRQGLVMTLTAKENLVLADLPAIARGGFIRMRDMRRSAAPTARLFGLSDSLLDERVRNLSGGNQQRVLLGRWHRRRPRILLADEPTRGIDVGAKAEILDAVRRLAAEGSCVIFVSSDLEEVVSIADHILVLSGGRVGARFDVRASRPTAAEILSRAHQPGTSR